MGSQWAGMGRAFMCLKPFSKAIHKCAAALKPYGLDLIDVINNGNEDTFKNLMNAFIGITAIQVNVFDQ